MGPRAMNDMVPSVAASSPRRNVGWVALLTVLLVGGCDAPSSPLAPTPEPLIPNGSFERAGSATLAGWRFGNPDLASAAPLGAPGYGAWSLRLDADWAPTLGFAYVSVPTAHPGDRLRLSAFVRAANRDGDGVISIVSGPSPGQGMAWSTGTVNPGWTLLSVEAVVPDLASDSVWVVLSSPHTEIVPRSGLFDGVALIRLPAPGAALPIP